MMINCDLLFNYHKLFQGDPTLQISRNFNQVHPVDEARKHLAERTRSSFRLQKEKLQQFSASLPGGLWCTGPSRDVNILRLQWFFIC